MMCHKRKHDLMPYEQVEAIEYIMEPFDVESSLLTSTFKSRRPAIEK